jgi:hypothetical protein
VSQVRHQHDSLNPLATELTQPAAADNVMAGNSWLSTGCLLRLLSPAATPASTSAT